MYYVEYFQLIQCICVTFVSNKNICTEPYLDIIIVILTNSFKNAKAKAQRNVYYYQFGNHYFSISNFVEFTLFIKSIKYCYHYLHNKYFVLIILLWTMLLCIYYSCPLSVPVASYISRRYTGLF